MKKWSWALVLALFVVSATAAQAIDGSKILANSKTVLLTGLNTPGQSIPVPLLKRAKAIVIIPGSFRASFIFGIRAGEGILMTQDENHNWSAPSFYSVGGITFGLQAGAQGADIVLLIMNEKGLHAFMKEKFVLGADMNVVVGPASLNAESNDDLLLHADILTYSWSRGLFAGVLINGARMAADVRGNAQYYGQSYTVDDIVIRRIAPIKPDAVDMVKALEGLTK